MEIKKLLEELGFAVTDKGEGNLSVTISNNKELEIKMKCENGDIRNFEMNYEELTCEHIFSTGKKTPQHTIVLIQTFTKCMRTIGVRDVETYNFFNRVVNDLAKKLAQGTSIIDGMVTLIAHTKSFDYLRYDDRVMSFVSEHDSNLLFLMEHTAGTIDKVTLFYNGNSYELKAPTRLYREARILLKVILTQVVELMSDSKKIQDEFNSAISRVEGRVAQTV